MKIIFIFISLLISSYILCEEKITPYKYSDSLPLYDIPASSRFTTQRPDATEPHIIYYFSKPQAESFPIAILCGGSSAGHDAQSIIHFHRYFLQEFLDLNVAVVTVEQRGVDGNKVDIEEFVNHYTRSNRLKDHQVVIEHLKQHPPIGWNGKFVFLGVSEGGQIVTSLTTLYPESTLATLNWSGARDWTWREELWGFVQKLLSDNPECPHHTKLHDCSVCLEPIATRDRYDAFMDTIASNPTSAQHFLGMTYRYHADALQYRPPVYEQISTPFLVVTGVEDTILDSSDTFVAKAKNAGVPITYFRIDGMDHYVRRRPDIIHQSFNWLKNCLNIL